MISTYFFVLYISIRLDSNFHQDNRSRYFLNFDFLLSVLSHRGSLQKQSSQGLEYRVNDICKSHYFEKVYVLHDECLRFSYEKATRNKQHYLIMTLILFLLA